MSEQSDEQMQTEKSAPKGRKPINAPLVVGVVIALLVAGGLIFLLRGEDKGKYSDEAREKYVSSCVEQSGQEELCACTYEKLSQQISYKEFLALDERVNTGATTQQDQELVSGIAFKCVAEVRR